MSIRYAVDLSSRHQHLVRVSMDVPAQLAAGARVVLPRWTPGSYFIRDYVHHLQSIRAASDAGPVALEADGVSAWLIADGVEDAVTIDLEFYANEATVRTNHVDDRHALIVPPATFPYLEGQRSVPCEIRFEAGGDAVFAMLPQRADGAFAAVDYDHLVDSAFEIGTLACADYSVEGVPHRFVWAGAGSVDLEPVRADARAIGEAAVALFDGDLPLDSYTFLCVGSPAATGGGLEHRDGATLMVPEHAFADPDRYRRIQGLIAHEYLHLYNGRRLSPLALVHPDYERPNPTPSLWVAEGWTTYYGNLLPLRAGLWPTSHFLGHWADTWTTVAETPGAARQSVREASYRAWTHHYVQDENSLNVGVDYYRHGAILAWCLDLLIRRERPDSDGLDEALRALWDQFGRHHRGYREDDVEHAVADAAGQAVSEFFGRHVAGCTLPPLADLVSVVGLQLVADGGKSPRTPDLGVRTTTDDDGLVLSTVLRDRPAWRGGLTGGDRLVAIDGVRVPAGQLEAALHAYEPGATIDVAVLSGSRLLHRQVTLGEPRDPWRLRPDPAADDGQRASFRRWTGRNLEEAS